MDEDDIAVVSGEFRSRAAERAWRCSQAGQELRQLRLLWGAALACIGGYLPLEYLVRGGYLPWNLVWPRLCILAVGATVLALLYRPGLRAHRDGITGAGLVLAMTGYGALLAARGEPSAGALLLLVLGSYLFSPGSFASHCVTGLAGSLGAVLAAGGSLSWLEISYLAPANILAALALAQLNRERRRLHRRSRALQREMSRRRQVQRRMAEVHRQNLTLLYNTLPAGIALQLRRSPDRRPARQVPQATLLFADIVGFSSLARRLSAPQLLQLLNAVFSGFDDLAERRELEKIKTIGDAYFAVSGLSKTECQPAARALLMALELRRVTAIVGRRYGIPLALRIGLHTGPVVAGVLGHKRFAFDVWGDSVNIASRLQSVAPAGGILVSDETRRRCPRTFRFGPERKFSLRGCGPVSASALLGGPTGLQASDDLASNRLC